MTKTTFLNELERRIRKYPDHNEIIQYYNELIQDKIDLGMLEDEAVASLGSIDEICKNIEEQRGIIKDEEEKEEVKAAVVENKQTQSNEPKRINGGKRFVYVLWVIATVCMCFWAIITLIVSIAFLIGTIGIMITSSVVITQSVAIAGFQFGIGLFLFGAAIVAVHYAKVFVKFIFTGKREWSKSVRKGLAGE